MNSIELVTKTIKGENNTGVTPVYGWLIANLNQKISDEFKSVQNFEDLYKFDMHHIFGGPFPYDMEKIENMRSQGIEITPDVLLDMPLKDPNNMDDYKGVVQDIEFYRNQRKRFCYTQSQGLFECLNSPFGIENQLMYMALYSDELKEVYKRQTEWNIQFENNMMDLGVDMIHISDDWGSQRSLLFSRDMYLDMIKPNLIKMAEPVKKRGRFLSLHSDGNIMSVLDDVCDVGFDIIHPFQESAGMDYNVYLNKYSDKFGILGGICVQTSLGFGNIEKLDKDINRVFSLLKGKRWVCCTTHYVQEPCTIEELVHAYDLINKLAGKK